MSPEATCKCIWYIHRPSSSCRVVTFGVFVCTIKLLGAFAEQFPTSSGVLFGAAKLPQGVAAGVIRS